MPGVRCPRGWLGWIKTVCAQCPEKDQFGIGDMVPDGWELALTVRNVTVSEGPRGARGAELSAQEACETRVRLEMGHRPWPICAFVHLCIVHLHAVRGTRYTRIVRGVR
jgi:hypothetical protein